MENEDARALADEVLRQETALAEGRAVAVGGYLFPTASSADGPRCLAKAGARRFAEDEDRRAWIEGVRRRLGLVAEVHRCRVWKRGEGDWAARCLRPGCPAGRGVGWAPSQQYALGDALAHAGAFLPLPLEEEPLTELQWALYVAFAEDAERQREADEAALGARIAAVTGQVNDAFAGMLPDGMRFEWVTDGG